MFTDLFVHRTTSMLLATGLRFPARVVGAGGIYLEYDGRDVPDVATVVADFPQGVQGLVTATMCCEETPIKQLIRGHNGSFVFGTGEVFEGFDFVAERPQVTLNSKIKDERIELGPVEDTSYLHFKNFCDAVAAGSPTWSTARRSSHAAMVIVKLGALSHREGKVFHFDRDTMTVSDGNPGWASMWEEVDARRTGSPRARLEGRNDRQRAPSRGLSETGRPLDQRHRSCAATTSRRLDEHDLAGALADFAGLFVAEDVLHACRPACVLLSPARGRRRSRAGGRRWRRLRGRASL